MHPILQRLRRTTPREVAVRGLQAARVAAERTRFSPARAVWRTERLRLLPQSPALVDARSALGRRDWKAADEALRLHFLSRRPRFLIDPARRDEFAEAARARFSSGAEDAVRRATPLLNGRYDLLGYTDLSFSHEGQPIDWHFDPVHRRRAPFQFWARVPYLDPAIGDHKIIWELNRHQHWLALGRAAWLTGDARYVGTGTAELESWLEANPPLAGINWSSMLELAFRALSWIWALHLFLPFEQDSSSHWVLALLTALDRQLDHISHHLSTYFSPNTHLLGEGLALYVAGRALPELRSAGRWERTGRAILLRETRGQVNADGGHAELSLHYHRYALDFYLLALAVARRTGDAATAPLADVVSRLAAFCRAAADDTGRLATIGDDDGGTLFPICGREPADASDSLSLAAALLDRPDFAVGEPPEEVFWMLGGDASALVPPRPRAVRGELFGETGYVMLRAAGEHAIVDAGPHGFLNGGHAHADALSLVLSVGGLPLLIDPGTATYTMDPGLRDRFRSTAMHNTLVLDGRAQSEPAGPFHWASRAHARVTLWSPAAPGTPAGRERPGVHGAPQLSLDFVEAQHDGYTPHIHRRGVLRLGGGLWLIADHLLGTGAHEVATYWHLDPGWVMDTGAARATQLVHAAGNHAALASTAPGRQTFHGDESGLGWCAPVYGRVVPSLTVRFSERGHAPLSVVTAIAAQQRPADLSIVPLAVVADREDGWHRAAVKVQDGDTSLLAIFATPATADVPADGEPVRGPARVRLPPYGEFVSDARVAVLRVSPDGTPLAVGTLAATVATWAGRSLVSPASGEAAPTVRD